MLNVQDSKFTHQKFCKWLLSITADMSEHAQINILGSTFGNMIHKVDEQEEGGF